MPARVLPAARLADVGAPGGLTTAEAAARRARYGPNDVLAAVPHPWRALAADTMRDPMLWFLVATGGLYAAIGDRAEALTLAAAIVPLAFMDAFLHRRTAASTAALERRLAARVLVLRDGVERELPARDLVPGDLVVVPPGTAVPADGILLGGDEVQVDEATLTGESGPIRKRPAAAWPPRARADVPIAGEHWLQAGTRILTGRARMVVVFGGAETLYGAIVRVAVAGTVEPTPLQRAIGRLVLVSSAAAALACIALAAVRLAQGRGWTDAIVSALTLAVAALPEELPVVFTFFLGVGVYRLARRRALVRRAAAVENVGRVTTICSDKTGTLTEGRLVLTHLVPAAGMDEARLLALAAAASHAESGDPLDVAVAAVAVERGVILADVTVVANFPFTEERRRETVVVRAADGTFLAATKGALETLLGCAEVADEAAWMARADALARGGHKVIACAWRALDPGWSGGEPTAGLMLAGLLACEDPVRPGVAAALAGCGAAGLRVVMVTGDHPLAAVAVAGEIGLGGGAPVVATGDEMAAAIAAGDPQSLVMRVDVVARATPIQKLALVRALQEAGELVAVTGDGVNDVPALRIADVGIAMGERGTQSAREVAPIVLLDDDFATIAGAIAEGRQLFQNLQRSLRYLLMMHVPFVATAALIPFAGYPLLYLPIHVVWMELVIHPTALLAFQAPAAAAVPTAASRRRSPRLLDGAQWVEVAVVGGVLMLLVAGGFLAAVTEGSSVAQARAGALLTLSLASAALTVVLSRLGTPAARVIAAATAGLAIVLVEVPALAARMHVAPLQARACGRAAFAALVVAGLGALFARRGSGAETA